MQKNQPVAVGIDIGTTKVRCVIGTLGESDTHPTIIGAGEAVNRGMRKGSVNNVEDVANSISAAIEDAERIAGLRVTAATVSINGSHVIGLNSKGVIAISGASREIGLEDLQRAEEAATVVQLPPNREIVQVFSKNYSLDGQDNIKDPVGMSGVRLEVDAHIVTAATPAVKNLDRALQALDIRANNHIVSGLAAAEATLTAKQRESGTAVVDFGAGTTDVIIFEDDEVQHVSVLPVGSINLTNDLAIGLRTDLDIAEEVKIQHGRAYKTPTDKDKIVVKQDHDVYEFAMRDIDAIIQARLDELFELIDREIKKHKPSRELPGGIVLTGGGAQLPDLAEYTKERLQLPARVGLPRDYSGVIDTTNNPAYAAAVGLMMQDIFLSGTQPNHSPVSGGFNSAMGGLKSLFSKFRP
jgi:cell division protein FtsA